MGFLPEPARAATISMRSRKKNRKYPLSVRTCGRPAVLRETLISLRHQTYPNMEVVVVEDGEEISGKMIRGREFGDMNIRYFATGEKVGRSRAGNLGNGESLRKIPELPGRTTISSSPTMWRCWYPSL